ncbi:helix-turn-helix transcriptional regulator [Streptomyces sp. JB150]|nr:helix-turn-helix transcriptional regulator [Streptomyces sp. JB150]
MARSPSSSVQAAREAVAARSREIRLDAGLTARQVALQAGWHPSKSSRIENGVTPPSDANVQAWCGICGAKEQAADLIAASDFRSTPNDVVEAVAARMDRARVLREGDHRFAILVEEAVLRYRMGNAEVMAGQLGHLLSIMSLPAVSLGVVPFSAERGMWPLETFSIYDNDQAQVELLTAAVNVTAPSEIAQYVKAFPERRNSPSTVPTHGR